MAALGAALAVASERRGAGRGPRTAAGMGAQHQPSRGAGAQHAVASRPEAAPAAGSRPAASAADTAAAEGSKGTAAAAPALPQQPRLGSTGPFLTLDAADSVSARRGFPHEACVGRGRARRRPRCVVVIILHQRGWVRPPPRRVCLLVPPQNLECECCAAARRFSVQAITQSLR